jgi:S1-C subfamily serine protease
VRVTAVAFDPFGEAQIGEGQGSGVVIDSAGVILTNNHVVQDATEVDVIFTDDREPLEGEVIGTVPEKDIAVIRVDADDLTPIEVGRSSGLRLGDDVVAIGFPLGLGGVTATKGIISATDRNIRVGTGGGPLPEALEGLLQTDAAINPGNSGGALVDVAGRLVGINTAAARAGSAENVGFAIPIDEAITIAEEILGEPAEQRAWLGVQIQSVNSSAVASQLGLDPSVRGALIAGIFPDGPAEGAGLEQGDVIVRAAGEDVTSAEGLTRALTQVDPGEVIEVTFLRGGSERTVEVEAGARPVTFERP